MNLLILKKYVIHFDLGISGVLYPGSVRRTGFTRGISGGFVFICFFYAAVNRHYVAAFSNQKKGKLTPAGHVEEDERRCPNSRSVQYRAVATGGMESFVRYAACTILCKCVEPCKLARQAGHGVGQVTVATWLGGTGL